MTAVSFVIPTRDRAEVLRRTLDALDDYIVTRAIDAAEVVVVEDDSAVPIDLPTRLPGGTSIELVRLDERHGAAARNSAAQAASGRWLVMLDDDSAPVGGDLDVALERAEDKTAVVGFEIVLPHQRRREDGGLPEVHIGCGAAIRRAAFLEAGGYDRAFDYYAEEYDLCARLIAGGWRIVHDFSVRVAHDKVAVGRDMNRIVGRLVRNNGWIMQRHAPDSELASALDETLARYADVAGREDALPGYDAGRDELERTLAAQRRSPLSHGHWARFTGADAARHGLADLRGRDVHLVAPGKNASVVRDVLVASGARVGDTGVPVVATLSPGPMLDAGDRYPEARRPWTPMFAPDGADPTGEAESPAGVRDLPAAV